MRLALNAIRVCMALTGPVWAADPPPKATTPTSQELLSVTEATRDFYRAANAADAAARQRQAALDHALALKAELEKKYACELNLDTNVCTPKPAVSGAKEPAKQ